MMGLVSNNSCLLCKIKASPDTARLYENKDQSFLDQLLYRLRSSYSESDPQTTTFYASLDLVKGYLVAFIIANY